MKAMAGLEGLSATPPATEVIGPSKHIYDGLSLFCLRPASLPRRAAIYTVENKLFDPIILVTILANCCTMAWESPLDPTGTWKEAFIGQLEWIYLYIFTFELVAKIIAYGFYFTKEAYIKDPWCAQSPRQNARARTPAPHARTPRSLKSVLAAAAWAGATTRP